MTRELLREAAEALRAMLDEYDYSENGVFCLKGMKPNLKAASVKARIEQYLATGGEDAAHPNKQTTKEGQTA